MRAGGQAIHAAGWPMQGRSDRGSGRMSASDSIGIDETRAAALAEADDRSLAAAFRDGERAVFDAIVVRHRRNVYQVCYRFVNNHEDASDLAQDVFVRAFRGLANFKGDAS